MPPTTPAPLRAGGADRERADFKRTANEPQSGERAVRTAKAMDGIGGGGAAAAPAATAPSAAPAERLAEAVAKEKGISEERLRRQMRNVGSKTFYASGNVWFDSLFKEGDAANAKTIKFLSPEYEALLKEKPGIAKYLALGEEMYVVYEGVLYHIVKAD
jgi:hypothetical protein